MKPCTLMRSFGAAHPRLKVLGSMAGYRLNMRDSLGDSSGKHRRDGEPGQFRHCLSSQTIKHLDDELSNLFAQFTRWPRWEQNYA